jgi:hypothetical protein
MHSVRPSRLAVRALRALAAGRDRITGMLLIGGALSMLSLLSLLQPSNARRPAR